MKLERKNKTNTVLIAKCLVLRSSENQRSIHVACCCAVPGSGLGKASQLLSGRVLRQFVNVTVFSPSMDSLLTLYSRPLHSWLEEFPTYSVEHHQELSLIHI